MLEKYKVQSPPSREVIESSITKGDYVVIFWKDKHNILLRSELYPKELYDGDHCTGHGMFNLNGKTVEVRYRFSTDETPASYIMFM